jgi:hypothetical protein
MAKQAIACGKLYILRRVGLAFFTVDVHLDIR